MIGPDSKTPVETVSVKVLSSWLHEQVETITDAVPATPIEPNEVKPENRSKGFSRIFYRIFTCWACGNDYQLLPKCPSFNNMSVKKKWAAIIKGG